MTHAAHVSTLAMEARRRCLKRTLAAIDRQLQYGLWLPPHQARPLWTRMKQSVATAHEALAKTIAEQRRRELPVVLAPTSQVACTWDRSHMTGTERVRTCTICNEKVFDLSGLSTRDAEALLVTETGPCQRLFVRPDGTVTRKGDCTAPAEPSAAASPRPPSRALQLRSLPDDLQSGRALPLRSAELFFTPWPDDADLTLRIWAALADAIDARSANIDVRDCPIRVAAWLWNSAKPGALTDVAFMPPATPSRRPWGLVAASEGRTPASEIAELVRARIVPAIVRRLVAWLDDAKVPPGGWSLAPDDAIVCGMGPMPPLASRMDGFELDALGDFGSLASGAVPTLVDLIEFRATLYAAYHRLPRLGLDGIDVEWAGEEHDLAAALEALAAIGGATSPQLVRIARAFGYRRSEDGSIHRPAWASSSFLRVEEMLRALEPLATWIEQLPPKEPSTPEAGVRSTCHDWQSQDADSNFIPSELRDAVQLLEFDLRDSEPGRVWRDVNAERVTHIVEFRMQRRLQNRRRATPQLAILLHESTTSVSDAGRIEVRTLVRVARFDHDAYRQSCAGCRQPLLTELETTADGFSVVLTVTAPDGTPVQTRWTYDRTQSGHASRPDWLRRDAP